MLVLHPFLPSHPCAGLGQTSPDVKRLAKYVPRALPPPPRPAKRRKTVISSLTGQSARVDRETAAVYFQMVSRIAEQLGVGGLSTEKEREAGGSWVLKAREECVQGVLSTGEAGAGERSGENPLSGGSEASRDLRDGDNRQEENRAGKENGASTENGAHCRGVQSWMPDMSHGACLREERNLLSERGSEPVIPNGTGVESLLARGIGVKDSVQSRSEAREGVSKNGCTAPPSVEKSLPDPVRGGMKTLVSAGVQTIYSARELHYRPTGLERAKKLVPLRRGTKKTANCGPRGDLVAQTAEEKSPRSAGGPGRVAQAEGATGRGENGLREREGTAVEDCHGSRVREGSLGPAGFGAAPISAGPSSFENGSRIDAAIRSNVERDVETEGQSAAQERLRKDNGIGHAGKTADAAREDTERVTLKTGFAPPSLLPPNQENSVLPTPPQPAVQPLTTPESGVKTPLPSAEPGSAAAAGPHSHQCPSNPSNSGDHPNPDAYRSGPGETEGAYSPPKTAPSPTLHADPASSQCPKTTPLPADALQRAADVSNGHLDCHVFHIDGSERGARALDSLEAAPSGERGEAAGGIFPSVEAAPQTDGGEPGESVPSRCRAFSPACSRHCSGLRAPMFCLIFLSLCTTSHPEPVSGLRL